MFDQIYKEHQSRIKGFTYKLCNKYGLMSYREDIEQEVIIKLLEWSKKHPDTTINSSFIYTTINHYCISFRRNLNIKSNVYTEVKKNLPQVIPSTWALSSYTNVYYIELIKTIIDNDLSKKLRETFLLFINGHSGKEISKMLNIPERTVRTRILRTRERIKRGIRKHYKIKEIIK